jgi:hypothetical protein
MLNPSLAEETVMYLNRDYWTIWTFDWWPKYGGQKRQLAEWNYYYYRERTNAFRSMQDTAWDTKQPTPWKKIKCRRCNLVTFLWKPWPTLKVSDGPPVMKQRKCYASWRRCCLMFEIRLEHREEAQEKLLMMIKCQRLLH